MDDVWVINGVEAIGDSGTLQMQSYIEKLNKLEVTCQ